MLYSALDTTPVLSAPPLGLGTASSAQIAEWRPPETVSGTGAVARVLRGISIEEWVCTAIPAVRTTAWTVEPNSVPYDAEMLPARTVTEAEEPTDEEAVTTGARAYAAFKDLGRWLMLPDPVVAEMVGVKRTTAYAWARDGREPRATTVRRLLQNHAIVAAVIDRLGDEAGSMWLAAGSPSAVELLLGGEIQKVDQRVGDLVFARTVQMPSSGSYGPDDDEDLPPSVIAARLA